VLKKKDGAIFVHRYRKPFGNIVVGLKEAGKGRCLGLKNSILSLKKKTGLKGNMVKGRNEK
jgi:hypothetical protein